MTSNARLIAELQAVSIGIHLVGLDRLPEVMRPVIDDASAHSVGTERSGVNQDSTHPAKHQYRGGVMTSLGPIEGSMKPPRTADMTEEHKAPVAGHTLLEGFDFPYEITREGRVFSLSGWRGVARRELVQSPNSHGYPRVFVMRHGRKVGLLVHTLVARAFLPPRPTPAHEVRHLDGVRTHCSADNLAWGTRRENAEDRARHGRTSHGLSHSIAIKRGLENHHA